MISYRILLQDRKPTIMAALSGLIWMESNPMLSEPITREIKDRVVKVLAWSGEYFDVMEVQEIPREAQIFDGYSRYRHLY